MSDDVCKDKIFCEASSQNYPYSIIYNQLDTNIDYSKKHSEYNRLISKITLQSDNTNITQIRDAIIDLYTKPADVLQTKYILVGKIDSDLIKTILIDIENTKSISDKDINILTQHFNYDVVEWWGINNSYHKIKFLEINIMADDTINLLKNMIIGFCNENDGVTFTKENIYIYCNRVVNIDNIQETISNKILKYVSTQKLRFNIEFLKNLLLSYLIPNNIIDDLFNLKFML